MDLGIQDNSTICEPAKGWHRISGSWRSSVSPRLCFRSLHSTATKFDSENITQCEGNCVWNMYFIYIIAKWLLGRKLQLRALYKNHQRDGRKDTYCVHLKWVWEITFILTVRRFMWPQLFIYFTCCLYFSSLFKKNSSQLLKQFKKPNELQLNQQLKSNCEPVL